MNSHVKMHSLPKDIVRYQLLSFLKTETSVRLTQTSQFHFHSLRHKIQRTKLVQSHCFIKQSQSHSKHIGLCSAASVLSNNDMEQLLKHIADQSVRKVSTLLHLKIDINEPLDDKGIVLPANLHTLTFGSDFNFSIKTITLPHNLHSLSLGFRFNQSLDGVVLPQMLHTLAFGLYFNKSIFGVTLPRNLNTLAFGWFFDQSFVDISLPQSLHTLEFGNQYNQPLDGISIPADLQILVLGCFFTQSLTNVAFPTNLTIFKRGECLPTHSLPPGRRIQYMKFNWRHVHFV